MDEFGGKLDSDAADIIRRHAGEIIEAAVRIKRSGASNAAGDNLARIISSAQALILFAEKGSTMNMTPHESDSDIPEKQPENLLRGGVETPRIMLVDDDNDSIVAVTRLFRRRFGEAQVNAYSDSVKAAEMLSEYRPHILITDIMMPGMSGIDLVKRLREIPHMNSARVMVITALSSKDERVKEIGKLGVSTILQKPYSVDDMIAVCKDLLRPIMIDEDRPDNQDCPVGRETIIDIARIRDIFEGNLQDMEDVCEATLGSIDSSYKYMKEALRNCDISKIELHSHTIKGAAAMIGAQRLSAVAEEMETHARDEDYTACDCLLARFEEEIKLFNGEARKLDFRGTS